MPIYEYRCEACGKGSTALLARWDSADPACPHCGKTELRRLVSSFATTGREDASDDDFDGDEGYGGESEDTGDLDHDDW